MEITAAFYKIKHGAINYTSDKEMGSQTGKKINTISKIWIGDQTQT